MANQSARGRALPVLRSQRALQVVLGLFWILDAALQFQPFMFGSGFVGRLILPMASGQPFVVADLISHVGRFLAPDIAAWNTVFALLQVFLGASLILSRSPRLVRTALTASFAWALTVWVIGEGMGMVLTGTASALTGAPGSVLLYGLVGLMVWPREPQPAEPIGESRAGVASSAAAHGIGRSVTPLVTWAGYWTLAALLFLLPDNRAGTSIRSAVTGTATGEPAWFANLLGHLGNLFATPGAGPAWILALVAVVVGLGPLVVRRPGWFFLAGALFAACLWTAGQGLLGGIFTGTATDPNSGPIVVVLALAMVPVVAATREGSRSPVGEIVRWNPAVAGLGGVAVVAALLIGASYPLPATTSTSTMPGMTMAGGGASATATSCHASKSGPAINGLDLSSTPMMMMTSQYGMNMNGEDASAAAGLNTTTPNWSYTGPALPRAEAEALLADGDNAAGDVHMAVSGCATALTSDQEVGAQQYVQETSAAVARYAAPSAAIAAGYVRVSPAGYPVTYYVNPAIEAANAAGRRTLDPQHVDGLVYAATPSGREVLAAAMYLLPATVTGYPMPYGALVQWHRRTAVCGPSPAQPGSGLEITGFAPCAGSTVVQPTPYLTMVWQVPVAGGPLAIQPPDIQIVEAAVMATLHPGPA